MATTQFDSLFASLSSRLSEACAVTPESAAAADLALLSRNIEGGFEVPATALPLLPFQTAAVEYIRQARRVLVGDQMGLGKTPVGIVATLLAESPALVVCPPSLTLNWVNEFARFSPATKVVRLTGTKPHLVERADVYVIGDAVLNAWVPVLETIGLKALVADESHRYKNEKAQRTAALTRIARGRVKVVEKDERTGKNRRIWKQVGPGIPADGVVVLLSGTAIKNRPAELLPQVCVLGREDVFGGEWNFLQRFCGPRKVWNGRKEVTAFDGATDLENLNNIMRGSFYIRRERSEVLDLPGKGRQQVAIEISGTAATQYKAAERNLIAFLRETKGAEAAAAAEKAEALVMLNTLRRLVGLAKIESTIAYVEDLVEQGEQVIVFAHHRDVVETIAAHFDAPTIMGGMKVEQVQAAKDAFQAGVAKVIVLNIEAGGVGHTLTAACHVVFAEFAWTPGEMDQAEDRADRIGQTRKVVSHWLVGTNGTDTIDARLVEILDDKARIVDAVNKGGKVDTEAQRQAVQSALLDTYRMAS